MSEKDKPVLPEIKRISQTRRPEIIPAVRYSRINKKDIDPQHLERISNANMQELTEIAQNIHPLPCEQQMQIRKTHRNWFIAKLQKAETEAEIVDLAFRLNHRQLSYLFPILATVNKKSTADKILQIISLRMSKFLYVHGWITFQYIYPDSRMAKFITSLCRDLDDQIFPFEITERKKAMSVSGREHLRFPLDYPHFDWGNIKLITEVAAPDNRRFMNNIVNYLLENQITPQEFFKEYAIYDDLALGAAIKSNYEVNKLEKSFAEIKGNNLFSWRDLLGFDSEDFQKTEPDLDEKPAQSETENFSDIPYSQQEDDIH